MRCRLAFVALVAAGIGALAWRRWHKFVHEFDDQG